VTSPRDLFRPPSEANSYILQATKDLLARALHPGRFRIHPVQGRGIAQVSHQALSPVADTTSDIEDGLDLFQAPSSCHHR
jgi:hypothetical protein